MKTVFPYLLATCLLFPWCSVRLFAQQNPTVTGEKKVTITRRSVEADGTEVTEIIVKKRAKSSNSHPSSAWSADEDDSAFLGVETDADEDASQPGIVVQVICNAAAAQAGLKTNDVLLRINDQPINRWNDLSAFMGQARPGDKVRITYQRNGQETTAEATLTTHSTVECDEAGQHGFLGVSESDEADGDEAGLPVRITPNSAAARAGLLDGDKIIQLNTTAINDFEDVSDFMSTTKPGDKVRIRYQRNDQPATAEATLGEELGWDWKEWNADDSDWKDLDFEVKQKAACLGVYTEATVGDNDRSGASIISFTAESAAREVQMLEKDVITAVNGQRVQNHDDLWAEIAKYKSGDQVKVDFLRSGEKRTVEALLKPCQDNSQVTIGDVDADGDQQKRQFNTWNWNSDDQQQMRQNRLITIHKGGEGDAAQVNLPPANLPAERQLPLESFRAVPNAAPGQVTVEFRAAPVATIMSLLDQSGRQLFREELNMFGGAYKQQFDLSEYAQGTIIILVQQGDKSFSEQIVLH